MAPAGEYPFLRHYARYGARRTWSGSTSSRSWKMLVAGPDRGKSMKKPYTQLRIAVTDSDRAITNHSAPPPALPGGQVKKENHPEKSVRLFSRRVGFRCAQVREKLLEVPE